MLEHKKSVQRRILKENREMKLANIRSLYWEYTNRSEREAYKEAVWQRNPPKRLALNESKALWYELEREGNKKNKKKTNKKKRRVRAKGRTEEQIYASNLTGWVAFRLEDVRETEGEKQN